MTDALIHLRGPAAALPMPNINTDTIAPLVRGAPGGGQPVGIRSAEELARRLFGPLRYLPDGRENPDFILNRGPWRQSRFLVAGANFACGSSRETAATMLKAFGIRCVIAPSFGEIFHDNCLRNHMLPLALDAATVQVLMDCALAGETFVLDVACASVGVEGGVSFEFKLPAFRRDMLMTGKDEVEATLAREAEIARWQAQARRLHPWVFPGAGPGAGQRKPVPLDESGEPL